MGDWMGITAPQHRLYFFPLLHGHGSFLPGVMGTYRAAVFAAWQAAIGRMGVHFVACPRAGTKFNRRVGSRFKGGYPAERNAREILVQKSHYGLFCSLSTFGALEWRPMAVIIRRALLGLDNLQSSSVDRKSRLINSVLPLTL